MKAFWKTSEFWGSLVSSVLPWVTSAVPHTWSVAISAVVTAAYSLSRGLAKGAATTPPGGS